MTPNSTAEVMIQAAKDAFLDLDAVEFSAVYKCLTDNLFFDHVSTECAPSCPAGTVVAHGQCAAPETESAHATFAASWRLHVECETESCVHNKLNMTLHFARLSVASHLDIPFQEVTASLTYEHLLGRRRRLATISPVILSVQVATKRHPEAAGQDLLSDFLSDADMASQLLSLQVVDIEEVPFSEISGGEIAHAGPDNDLYSPAYEKLEQGGGSLSPLSRALGSLPLYAITAIAVSVVLVGAVLVGFLWNRRRQGLLKARAVRGKVVEVEVEEPVPNKLDPCEVQQV
jgi:hypothetical protein